MSLAPFAPPLLPLMSLLGRCCVVAIVTSASCHAAGSMAPAKHPPLRIAPPPHAAPTPVQEQELSRCSQSEVPDASAPLTALEEIIGSSTSTSCRIVPAFRNGRAIGLKIFGVRHDDALVRAGVLAGDVATCLNGYTLDSPASALEAWTTISLTGRARVTLSRGRETLTVDFLSR